MRAPKGTPSAHVLRTAMRGIDEQPTRKFVEWYQELVTKWPLTMVYVARKMLFWNVTTGRTHQDNLSRSAATQPGTVQCKLVCRCRNRAHEFRKERHKILNVGTVA
jgi:hypothetical protein